jgi:hypothetical protein
VVDASWQIVGTGDFGGSDQKRHSNGDTELGNSDG